MVESSNANVGEHDHPFKKRKTIWQTMSAGNKYLWLRC